MHTDEKAENLRAYAGDTPGGTDPGVEEIIDLVDEVPPDNESSQLEQSPEIESEPEVDDEDLIELTDVVEENFSETKIGDTTLEEGAEEILEPVREQGSEEEEPIELVDEVVPEVDSAEEEEPIELVDEVLPEVDSAQEQEEPVEVDDLTEGLGSAAEKTGSPELSEAEIRELSEAQISTSEPDKDSLIDTLGIEKSQGDPETPADQVAEDGDSDVPEEAEQPLVDTVETQPEAEDRSELGLEEGAPEPVGGAVEQAVLEKLSEERLEEIITRTVKQIIEEKVERILLDAAESAIAKELERLKPAH